MRVTSIQLCDAATVREGLLHVLGAGPTRIVRPMFPAPLVATIAIQWYATADDLKKSHRLAVAVVQADENEPSGRIELTFGPPSTMPELEADEEVQVPLVIPAGGFVLPAPGQYRLMVEVDDAEVGHLSLTAELPTAASEASTTVAGEEPLDPA